jgi:hypothetical protein
MSIFAGLRKRHALAALLVVLVAICASAGVWVWARPAATPARPATVTLRLETSRPGNAFDLGAVGLSMDANELGARRLSARRRGLVRLMRLLGPSLLRIGGDAVDLSWWTATGEPPPAWATNTATPADLHALGALLHATGWRVLLGLDLGHFEPSRAADEARVAQQILGGELAGVEIGNEPDVYNHRRGKVVLRPPAYDVGEYLREAQAYRQALASAAPDVAVYGPALSTTAWLPQLGAEAALFTEITQHYYPAGECSGGPPAASQPTAAELLSPQARQQEYETLATLARVGALAGRPTRIGETGTGTCRGNSPASPVFASALWALDWALRAVDSGTEGLNFHGHLGLCGADNQSPICGPTAAAAKALEVVPQPELYGLLAARQLEGGRFVQTGLSASESPPDLTTWATLAPDGTIKLAIDDLAVGGTAQAVSIPINGYTATVERLTGPSIEARSGIALGGAAVSSAGRWRPKSARLARKNHSFLVLVQPASAVIVTLHPGDTHHRKNA